MRIINPLLKCNEQNMGEYFYKTVLTVVSVTAFSVLDKMKKGAVLASAVGGALTYTAEFFLLRITENVFLVYFISAGITCVYSEIMARVKRMPSTVLMLPGIIPLVPGSLIYRAMRGVLEGSYDMYKSNLVEALLAAGGIASAAALVGAGTELVGRVARAAFARLGDGKSKRT